ncbi:uncharacterized protein TNCV_3195391 [Trichonephila clavipes]|nr:uncharacterized protein TNCV_3195391 [Trichonephila clavipes]
MPLLGMVNFSRGRVFEGSFVGMRSLTFDNKDRGISFDALNYLEIQEKDRILKLAENVSDQQNNDINSTPFISLCLDESIDITLNLHKRYYYKKLQVLPKLEKNIKDLNAQEKRNEETVIDEFISIIDSLIKEFSAKFSQSKELSETFKFIMYPDGISFDKLNLSQFDWLEIEEYGMQLIDFQSSSIWIQEFIETRKKLELRLKPKD